MLCDDNSEPDSIPKIAPKHVAIIMDGNGRWANQRDLARIEGHRRGAETVRDITTYARELGISYLTLFSFSHQNWSRPPEEVAGLMQLLEDYCTQEHSTLMENQIRFTTIGELGRLPASTQEAIETLCEETAENSAMTLTLALDYGGREELVRAIRALARDVRTKKIIPDKIDEAAIEARLDTSWMPDPDLLIRTSGELRLSNFLLWQSAWSELYFSDVLWPDFSRADFDAALDNFAGRERRFGGLGLDKIQDESEVFELGVLPEIDNSEPEED